MSPCDLCPFGPAVGVDCADCASPDSDVSTCPRLGIGSQGSRAFSKSAPLGYAERGSRRDRQACSVARVRQPSPVGCKAHNFSEAPNPAKSRTGRGLGRHQMTERTTGDVPRMSRRACLSRLWVKLPHASTLCPARPPQPSPTLADVRGAGGVA